MLYFTDNELHLTLGQVRKLFPDISFPVDAIITEGPVKSYNFSPQPDFNRQTHAIKEVTPKDGNQQWEVYPLSEEQINANTAARLESNARQIANKIEVLWNSANSYVNKYISGVAIGILTIGVMQQKPKALAVSAWSSSIWAEYYRRKELVTIDSVDDLDFSSFGAIPHSVPELQAEFGL